MNEIIKCPKCGNSENLHTNYDYSHRDMPILDFLCNECGEIFYDSYYDTLKHINKVRHNITTFVDDLNKRAMVHDASKLESPEKEYFDKYTPELKDLEYGTPEYRESIQRFKASY